MKFRAVFSTAWEIVSMESRILLIVLSMTGWLSRSYTQFAPPERRRNCCHLPDNS